MKKCLWPTEALMTLKNYKNFHGFKNFKRLTPLMIHKQTKKRKNPDLKPISLCLYKIM